MKRTYLISSLLLLVAVASSAQVLRAKESALVYYMPKTQLTIELTYERISQQPGVFYQYAQRYLGSDDVITQSATTYRVTNIQLGTCAVADTSRVFKVPAHTMHNLHLLTLSHDGRLLGYNCHDLSVPQAASHNHIHFDSTPQPSILPLLEEQFMAGSIAKMAEGAAKLIYHIRDMRMHLLAGDVEHMPADGQSLQVVLDQLAQQEQQLVALFVGATHTTTCRHTIYYTPDTDTSNLVIARFSKFAGVVDSDDLSGEPIYLSLLAYRQVLQEPAEPLSKRGLPAHIYYNLPGSADVTISYQGREIEQHLAVAQLGCAVPLSNLLFMGKPKFSIKFNPETGNIIAIQQ